MRSEMNLTFFALNQSTQVNSSDRFAKILNIANFPLHRPHHHKHLA